MRFGFIGTNFWAEDVYAGAVSVTENVAFVGVGGRDHGATKESGRTATVPCTTDVRLALDSALRTLVEMVRTGVTAHACDVRCGQDLAKHPSRRPKSSLTSSYLNQASAPKETDAKGDLPSQAIESAHFVVLKENRDGRTR